MIGEIDALILARDDPENHVVMARPFIEAGIPVFIDKPLAATSTDLAFFERCVADGKFIMSCSSMRYAAESRAVRAELASLGSIELATVVGKKDWIKYGVHMLEGLFALLDDPKAVSVQHTGSQHKDVVTIRFESGLIAAVCLFYNIAPTFQISLFGQHGWRLIEYSNWYAMFRDNLSGFIRSVRQGKPGLDFGKTRNIIYVLIGARQSLQQNGKVISLLR
jgi:predicted dehydrogenase